MQIFSGSTGAEISSRQMLLSSCVFYIKLYFHLYFLGYIYGVEVIGEFTVHSQGGLFEWKGYGMKIHIPKNSFQPGVRECTINVLASFAGQLLLPDESELLSPIFWISASCKFTKPVTLEIQHSTLTEDELVLSNLSFVSTKCSQRDLPYRFTLLDGGVFTMHSSYGSIQLNHFSGNAVTGKKNTPRSYCGHLYYSMKQMSDWRCYFIITQDLDSINTVHCIFSYDCTLSDPSCDSIAGC